MTQDLHSRTYIKPNCCVVYILGSQHCQTPIHSQRPVDAASSRYCAIGHIVGPEQPQMPPRKDPFQQNRGTTLSGSIPGRGNPNLDTYPVTQILAANKAISVPLAPPQSYAQAVAQSKSKQTQSTSNLDPLKKMSGKQASAGGKAPPKAGSTLHGRPALDVSGPATPRPPKPKWNDPPPNENWEQDGEMNAHLAEKFRKGAFKDPGSEEQIERERALPPHPLLAK